MLKILKLLQILFGKFKRQLLIHEVNGSSKWSKKLRPPKQKKKGIYNLSKIMN